MDSHLSISGGFVKRLKVLIKRDDFDFDIVNFPFPDGDVPPSISYGVYIFLNLFVLLECPIAGPIMAMTLILVIKF